MDYRNADGSAVEMCGNGVRVFARYLVDHWLAPPGEVPVATRAGVKLVRLGMTGDVTVDMGVPRFPGPDDVKVAVGDRSWPAVTVDMGNPHAVVFVDDLAAAGPLTEAPAVEPGFPDGVNVEFVVDRGERHVAMRVHERGVGETRSCGTGACAAMLAAAGRAGEPGPVSYRVDVPGGRLTVATRADGHVELTGPAVLLGEGELDEAWVRANS
jgi:diaminopimelate epimerase